MTGIYYVRLRRYPRTPRRLNPAWVVLFVMGIVFWLAVCIALRHVHALEVFLHRVEGMWPF
jgi:hypothetical protein